ncbi:FtsX-like permease family protein [Virgibacillus soli]
MRATILFTYAWKFLWNDKKYFLSVIGALTIFFSFITITSSMLQTYVDAEKELAYANYGNHSFIIYSDEQLDSAEIESKDFISTGLIYTLGLIENFFDQNIDVTIGAMDQNILHQFKLTDGKYPTANNEVVVERFLLDLYKENKHSHTELPITMDVHGQAIHIVGAIENYSSTWSQPDIIEKGSNTFPTIIFTGDFETVFPKVNQYITLFQEKKEKLSLDYSKVDYFLDTNNVKNVNGESITFNDALFNRGLTKALQVRTFSIIFIIIVSITGFLVFIYLFSFYYGIRFRRNFKILKQLGWQKQHIYRTAMFQGFIIGFSSFLCMLSLYFTLHFSMVSSYHIHWKILIGLPFIAISATVSIIYMICKRQYATTFKSNFIRGFLYKWIQKLSFKWKFFCLHVFHFIKSLILIVCLMTSLFILLFVSQLIATETLPDSGNDPTSSDYLFISRKSGTFDVLQQFYIDKNPPQFIRFQDVEELENNSAIRYIEKIPETRQTSLLIDATQTNATLFYPFQGEVEEDTNVEHTEIDYERLRIADTITPLRNIDYIILNDKNWPIFKRQVKVSDDIYDSLQNSLSSILYLPNEQNSIDTTSPLSIGRIEETEDGLAFKSWDLNILTAVNKLIHPVRQETYENVTLFLHEQTVQQYDIFPGYASLDIFMNNDAKKQDIQKVEDQLASLAVLHPDNLLYMDELAIKNDTTFANFISLLGYSLFIILLLCICAIIMLVFLMKFYQREREFLIYRALGGTRKDILRLFILELCIYYLLALLITIIILSVTLFILPAPAQSVLVVVKTVILSFILMVMTTGIFSYIFIKKLHISKLEHIQNKYL